MCFPKLIPSLLITALAVGVTAAPAKAQLNLGGNVVINEIDLEGIAYDAATGLLTATGGTVSGTIAGLPFVTDIENFSLDLLPDTPAGPCSILNLELAPIDIDLLGLHVDTSAICLNITAMDIGLLGSLLCDVAGGNLGLLDQLLDELAGLLEDVLGGGQPGIAQAEPADICDGECEILDLAVGPVELNLLGLNVKLDDCDDGAVLVCVSASEGEGLLGDLLCGLAGGGILPDLDNIADLIDSISDILDDLVDLDLTQQQINRLVRQVARALNNDGELSGKELRKLIKAVTKLL